jgi:signal peptidase I
LLIALGLIFAGFAVPSIRYGAWRIGYDPQSESCLPWSLYLVRAGIPSMLSRGDLVMLRQADLEKAAALEFAQDPTQRLQVIPPAVKYVAAVPGDVIEVRGDAIWVNGNYFGKLWLKSWVESKFPSLSHIWPNHPVKVPNGMLLVLGTSPLAFDGRYFGLVPKTDVTGRVWPI